MPTKPAKPSATRRRGRPAKPGGPTTPQVEVQRAYRARLAAAGKVVRIVDAGTVETMAALREQLRAALERLELRDEEVARRGRAAPNLRQS